MQFKAARRSCVTMLGMLLISAGCAATPDAELSLLTASIPPSDQRPSDGGVALGKQHYAAADYGLAERHFRAAWSAPPRARERARVGGRL